MVLAFPGASGAAQLATDRVCYLDQRPVTLSGTGFTPGAPYQVTLDGQPITGGTGHVDPAGGVTGTFVPKLIDQGSRVNQHRYKLVVQQGSNFASSKFTVTKFTADFTPGSGDPEKLRVRFSAYGFGLATPNPDVFVHYVRPNGKLKRTVRLGRAKGTCGYIARTRKRPLFPFKAERGTWNLQFDTNGRYRRGQASSQFLFYSLGVRIRRAPAESSATSASAVDPRRAALDAAYAKWKRQKLRNYRYRLRITCFCPDARRAINVIVRNGKPRRLTGYARQLSTVPRLFARIREALRDPKAGEVTARYDRTRGFPRVAAIDRIRLAIDDEIGWTVDRFRPLRPR